MKWIVTSLIALLLSVCNINAQTDDASGMPIAQRHRLGLADTDTLKQNRDNDMAEMTSSINVADSVAVPDSMNMKQEFWRPDPQKAVWYALLFPGAGQIYNRKYWKLPIVYGGFVACTYALTWNNTMYSDYSRAYSDIMDSNPNTNSFKDFLGPAYNLDDPSTIEQLKRVFKNKKDYYRKYRDLSIFVFVGVYVLFVIDAYVDAELSDFDITPDLGMSVGPAAIYDNVTKRNSYGFQFSITF